jgi:FG-GAP-like repeat
MSSYLENHNLVVPDSALYAAASLNASVSNPQKIHIKDNCPPCVALPPTNAKPYPSDIIVSGQPTITKLTTSIFDFWHDFPDDVDILMVGPTGAKCLLMADCGGSDFISNVNLTFNDSSLSLPDDSQITSGTFRPTKGTCPGGGSNCVPANFPGGAPVGPYGTALSVFNGTPSDGTWQLYVIDDSSGDNGTIAGGWSLTFNAPGGTSKAKFDFDGDGKADLAVWRPSDGFWYIINSSTGGGRSQGWGGTTDKLVPGDYDGDGKTDVAIWRPSDGNWWIINSSNGSVRVQQWGLPGDVPVPADYDGDGKTDLAVWRPSDGFWYIINSSTGGGRAQGWGGGSDKPVPGDYDGDGKADLAIWRPSDGNWWIINSSNGSARVQNWGLPADIPVPGDYDGDGKTDLAVWRPSDGFWYIINSSTGDGRSQGWGGGTDKPVPGDYDGDGRTDLAIWRPSDGNWWIINSSNGSARVQNWGVNGDVPIPSVFIR